MGIRSKDRTRSAASWIDRHEVLIPAPQGAAGRAFPPFLTDARWFDTIPDDYVASGELPDDEFVHRIYHRRPKFAAFINAQQDALAFDVDRHDWSLDESTHPLLIDSSQVDLLLERATEAGFEVEVGDQGDDGATCKAWVYDPRTLALMPEGYNPYTLRNPMAVARRSAPTPERIIDVEQDEPGILAALAEIRSTGSYKGLPYERELRSLYPTTRTLIGGLHLLPSALAGANAEERRRLTEFHRTALARETGDGARGTFEAVIELSPPLAYALDNGIEARDAGRHDAVRNHHQRPASSGNLDPVVHLDYLRALDLRRTFLSYSRNLEAGIAHYISGSGSYETMLAAAVAWLGNFETLKAELRSSTTCFPSELE